MTEMETLLQRAQALIFDCDGTLVQTPTLYAGAWQDAFRAAGHHMEPDWYHARAGMSEHVLLDDYEAEARRYGGSPTGRSGDAYGSIGPDR